MQHSTSRGLAVAPAEFSRGGGGGASSLGVFSRLAHKVIVCITVILTLFRVYSVYSYLSVYPFVYIFINQSITYLCICLSNLFIINLLYIHIFTVIYLPHYFFIYLLGFANKYRLFSKWVLVSDLPHDDAGGGGRGEWEWEYQNTCSSTRSSIYSLVLLSTTFS